MTTKTLNTSTSNKPTANALSKRRFDRRLKNWLILFSKSGLGDKCFTVLARVLGFGAILGSLGFAAWGIISTAM